jgi:NAD(P)-dependent dehydrogenase (short-subunit alcohol dehydrogenase family)
LRSSYATFVIDTVLREDGVIRTSWEGHRLQPIESIDQGQPSPTCFAAPSLDRVQRRLLPKHRSRANDKAAPLNSVSMQIHKSSAYPSCLVTEHVLMNELRFDGKVAIVTGAGGSANLGRAHARLLAARGAKVVVNDLGVGPNGRSTHPADARSVAAEIVAVGGEAIADLHSVAEEESAVAIVQAALNEWGRIDILINNAGVGLHARFPEATSRDIRRAIDVHLMGSIWMCRAAWPHMVKAGYGRIVNTVSAAMFGMEATTVYGAAKFGIYGLTRGLAAEGLASDGQRVKSGRRDQFHGSWSDIQGSGDDQDVLRAFSAGACLCRGGLSGA